MSANCRDIERVGQSINSLSRKSILRIINYCGTKGHKEVDCWKKHNGKKQMGIK